MNTQKQNTMKMEINHTNDNFTVMSMLAPKALDHIIRKLEKPAEVTGITTCFPSLDFYTCGLQRGDLIVVAGRPSMGKQSFVRNIAMHVALVNNLSVVLLDSEKSEEYQVIRMITSMAKMDFDLLHRGQISNDDIDLLKSSFAFLNDVPIYFPKLIPATVEELGVELHKLDQKTGGLGLIVADCLSELKFSGESMNEDQASNITYTSRHLKMLAQELNVPVIVLSPINCALEERNNKWPVITDLPGMGAIANAADLVLMICRDEVYNPDTEEKGMADIIVSKNVDGYVGSFKLKFNGRYESFEEIK